MGLYLLLLILLVKIEPPGAKSGENVAVIVDCVWPMYGQCMNSMAVEPFNGNPIMANSSRPGMQYWWLINSTHYFTIRIALHVNTTVDVIPATTKSFITSSKLGYDFCFHFVDCGVIEQLYMYMHVYVQRLLLPPLPWPLLPAQAKHPPSQLVPLRVEVVVVDVLLESSMVFSWSSLPSFWEVSDFFLTCRLCGILQ